MKYTFLFAVFALTTSAITIEPKQFDSKKDDAFMAKTFEKYSTLGKDSADLENGKRVLTYQNAKWAARDIVMTWKNMSSSDAETFVEGKFDKAWHTIDTSNKDLIDTKSAYWLVR